MLTFLLGLVSLALALALARQRAEIIRLRAGRRLAYVPSGSWEAFHQPRPGTPGSRWWPKP